MQISISKDSFHAIVLRIHMDLLDSWKQVESFENWLDLWSRYEPNFFKSGFVIHDTNQIFLSPDSWPTNRYESMDLQNESMFLQISYTIPASLNIFNVGFLLYLACKHFWFSVIAVFTMTCRYCVIGAFEINKWFIIAKSKKKLNIYFN